MPNMYSVEMLRASFHQLSASVLSGKAGAWERERLGFIRKEMAARGMKEKEEVAE